MIRTEAIHALMRQLVGMGVFQDEEDVRKEALTDYDVMLPPTEKANGTARRRYIFVILA